MKSFCSSLFIFALIVFGITYISNVAPFAEGATLTPAERAALEAQLKQVEAEEAIAQKQLVDAQAQSSSISRDIAVLDARIKTAQLEIKAKNLLIKTLGDDITLKEKHIDALEVRIEKGKASLADLMRKTRELDDYSVPEVLLSQDSISGFFKDIDTFRSIQTGLQAVADQLIADETATTKEKETLDARRNTEMDARYTIQQKEASIKSDQAQKQKLLNISKGNEKAYSGLVAEKKAQAVKIRAALFALRDSAAIPFGTALQYANGAYARTGVRPAFLLAIITQESALGSNVGSCYVTNNQTGDGVNSKTNASVLKVMSPTRDVPVFLEILKSLGTEQARAVVSCPQSIGWGGAMGPAQFIPSTWKLFINRIASALGLSGTPDPWNPEHAFMASAMYLGDLGAGQGGYTAERTAACKYYSGKACGLVTGNTAYGNSVIAKANTIQTTMIDPLLGL